MATLNLDVDQFADVAMIWLFDQVMNPEQVQNKEFQDFLKQHRSKLKAPLIAYYLDSPTKSRFNYKRIKGIFDGSDKSVQQIRVGPSDKIEQIEKEKEGIIKKVIKKVLLKQSLSIEDEKMLKEIIENDDIL